MNQTKKGFLLDAAGYFRNQGVDVMAFDDFYPSGHQAGVSIIMHGNRIATCGDIRLEPTPGQWQPIPKQGERTLDREANTITTTLQYPDLAGHLRGFNPMIYPDLELTYKVTVRGEEDQVTVTVDLDKPVPETYLGKLCFNLELFPGTLFDQPWIMDGKQGIFPRQPNGPTLTRESNYVNSLPKVDPAMTADGEHLSRNGGKDGYSPIVADDIVAVPYAAGKRFTLCPDNPLHRLTIESLGTDLKLYDGRMNHNNGWFVLSCEIPAGVAEGAVRWVIRPNVEKAWTYPTVVQVSQVGYHPDQPKTAFLEIDRGVETNEKAILHRLTETGWVEVGELPASDWGNFLRYRYVKCDFTHVTEEGMYQITCGESKSAIFRIAADVYDRGVWQPVLEYFLPVQMCHMRVNEKYRVWHGLCHNDDARMAPVNYNHIDGYVQGDSTLTKYKPGDSVPGLNVGGWHDAGDYDLRVESQSGEFYILSNAYECFGVNYDVTSVDQAAKVTEIHQPDGKNDLQQQIEHGVLSVVAGYRALGRLYRGIICNDLRQYVLLGDGAAMTDGIPGNEDDRWVFTENNPHRELSTAAHLAAASRALKGFNDELAAEALDIAQELYAITDTEKVEGFGGGRIPADKVKAFVESAKVHAACELFLTTGEETYRKFLLSKKEDILQSFTFNGWIVARVVHKLGDADFAASVESACHKLREEYEKLSAETPYGIPYRPHIWGAGWDIQRLGYQYYFLHRAFPEIFGPELMYNALNFVLGCHPGSNTASFASGVGANSATVAYGINRADWSYIPGGVVSGTALIRPDFPELLEFPYLWQQTEYVMGGGSSHYMFLVLATLQELGRKA
ncbi:MAG: glycoside hydrolase family 9 protein [Clostridia bacterium]|nr:glycoside hydrolase family 9 protein [Clostridia bacterium]